MGGGSGGVGGYGTTPPPAEFTELAEKLEIGAGYLLAAFSAVVFAVV